MVKCKLKGRVKEFFGLSIKVALNRKCLRKINCSCFLFNQSLSANCHTDIVN